MRIVGFIAVALAALVVLGGVVLLVASIGDIQRYLRIRRM